jgi:hypothetical protein
MAVANISASMAAAKSVAQFWQKLLSKIGIEVDLVSGIDQKTND